jgi:hypothetical protein
MFSASPNWLVPALIWWLLRTAGTWGLTQKWAPPTRPFQRNPVELPGPAPFSQASRLTILRLPQSVYIPIIMAGAWISNGFQPFRGPDAEAWKA